MDERPYVLLSCAISVDGCLDDAGPERLILSSDADLDRVDEVRAGVDAILVGANTVRRDNPRLLLRDPRRRAERVAAGKPPDPAKVTLTRTGELDPGSRFFTTGEAEKLVYAAGAAVEKLTTTLGTAAATAGTTATRTGPVEASPTAGLATLVDAAEPLRLDRILADLRGRGVERLMVEGGSGVLSWFLAEGHADELHLVVAPLLVGDPAAPRWLRPDARPSGRLRLLETRELAGCVLLRYALEPADG